MRFLIVDDFATMRRVLRGVLREMKIDAVDEAADGVAALEKLRGSEFDFVITDIGMPTMNGFELLSAIMKDERLRHLPVLMVTAEAKKDDIVRCTREGAAGYIVKPFTGAILGEKLRRAAPRLFPTE
jgi:two-component system chemotaxis response regulator CheY